MPHSSQIIINCRSSDIKLMNKVRSIVHVLNLGHSVNPKWFYGDKGIVIHIIDMDDEDGYRNFSPSSYPIVIIVSNNPEFLASQKYVLSKPVRNQALQEILRQIESSIDTNTVKSTTEKVDITSMPQIEAPQSIDISLETAVPHHTSTEQKETLYRLQAWPDISLMSEDMMLDAARVSALLAIRPASLSFMSSFLDTPIVRLEHIMNVISSYAHVDYPCLAESLMLSNIPKGDYVDEPKAVAKPSSILSKIWNRLKGAA